MRAQKFICSALSVVLALGVSPATALASTTNSSNATDDSTPPAQIEGTEGVDYTAGEVLVAVRGGVDALQSATATSTLSQLFGAPSNEAGKSSFSIGETLASVSADDISHAAADLDATDEVNLESGEAQLASTDLDATDEVNLESGEAQLASTDLDTIEIIALTCDDVAQAIADLQKLDCVVVAQPNYQYSVIEDSESEVAESVSSAASSASADTATTAASSSAQATLSSASPGTSEPFFSYQWSLLNNKSLNIQGYSGTTSLNVQDAWSEGAGNETDGEVVVAVVDSGVDYTHEDLNDNMWTGGDATWSTALGGGTYGYNASSDNKRSDPMDTSVGHGTHCASTIAAEWNSVGIAGVNNKVKIMAVRCIPGGTSDTISAYNYVVTAKQNGVNVVAASNSWGPSYNSGTRDILLDAMVYKAGTEGIISVFAAGNASYDNDLISGAHLNSANPYLLQVGALNSTGEASVFTQYGKLSVDVFSPGVQVLAATSTYGEQTGKSIQMNPQYLPWLTNSVSSKSAYFVDDASAIGTRTDGITYDLVSYDSSYNMTTIGSAESFDKGYSNQGVNNNKSIKFSLENVGDAVSAGTTVAIRITIPAATWKSYKERNKGDALYISAIGGFSDSGLADPYLKTSVRTSSTWVQLSGALNGAWDHNWYSISSKTSFTDVDNGRGENGDVTILYNVRGLDKSVYSDADYVYLDNISLGWACTSGEGTPDVGGAYYYSDGTSMATPNVSGVVSLLCSHAKAVSGSADTYQQTEATAKEIVSFVKGGVTQLDTLSDKCGTGGVANAASSYTAYAAYTSATTTEGKLAATASLKPVPDSIKDNGNGTSTLSGSFFGADQGSVTFAGQTLEVVEGGWTDTAITFKSLSTYKEQVGKVVVTKANSVSGQDYLILPAGSDSAASFDTLANPNFDIDVTFTGDDGKKTTISGNANEVEPYHMAAAGGYVYVYGVLGETVPVLMRYNVASQTWDTENYLDGYADQIDMSYSRDYTSIAAGATEIYLKYFNLTDKCFYLMTIDAATGDVKHNVGMGLQTNGYGCLGFYNGKLYVVGGSKGEPACVAVYPDTGVSYWASSTALPCNALFGNVTCNGSGFTITGSFAETSRDNSGYQAGARNEEIDVHILPNETMCEVSDKVFFPQKGVASQYGLDEGQSFVGVGAAAVNDGVIVTGPVRNNEADGMVDTWIYNWQVGSWTAVLTAKFSPTANPEICSCTYNGIYYVMASCMQQDSVDQRFASFEIKNWGLTDNLVKAASDAACAPSLADATVAPIEAQVYTGSALTPGVVVTYNGATLTLGTDYTIAYLNEQGEEVAAADLINAATYTVEIKGAGIYIGSTTAQFVISKASQDAPSDLGATGPTDKKTADGTITGVTDAMEYSADNGTTWTAVASGATTITGLMPGTYLVRFAETANYLPSEPASVVVPGFPSTVTFDANGHGTAPDAVTVAYGSCVEEPTAPRAVGCTFRGWYTDAACTQAYDFATSVTKDLTLYAKWAINADASAFTRLAGETAWSTMAQIVKAGWTSADTVVLASFDGYWDALSASSIAGIYDAPVIYTSPNELNETSAALIKSLGATRVIIMGGTAAISLQVQSQLATVGYVEPDQIIRVAGDNAAETAIEAARASDTSEPRTFIIATANGYWDALAAGSVSYASNMPILLANASDGTSSDATMLDAKTLNYLVEQAKAGKVDGVWIVGGTAAVSSQVEEQISQNLGAGTKVTRLAGANAVETSNAIAAECIKAGKLKADGMGIATVSDFHDALAGAALCGKRGSVVLLADGNNSAAAASGVVTTYKNDIIFGNIFGGTAAVPDSVLDALNKVVPPAEA